MIPVKNKIGICEVCECEGPLTYGHIIPQWLLRDVSLFGISFNDLLNRAQIKGKLGQKECPQCNTANGSNLDWKNPKVRKFIIALTTELYEKVQRTESPSTRKITAICGCARKEPCAVVPSIIDSRIPVPTPAPVKLKPAYVIPGKTWYTDKPHTHWKGTCWCGHIDIPETEATPEKLLAAEKWKEKSMKRNDDIVAEIIKIHGTVSEKEADMVKQD